MLLSFLMVEFFDAFFKYLFFTKNKDFNYLLEGFRISFINVKHYKQSFEKTQLMSTMHSISSEEQQTVCFSSLFDMFIL